MKRLFILFALASAWLYAAAINTAAAEPFSAAAAAPSFQMRSTSASLPQATRRTASAQYSASLEASSAPSYSTSPLMKGLREGSRRKATSPVAGFTGNAAWSGKPTIIAQTADETLGANEVPVVSRPRKGPGGGFSGGTDIPEPTIVPMGDGVWFLLAAALIYMVLFIRKKKLQRY